MGSDDLAKTDKASASRGTGGDTGDNQHKVAMAEGAGQLTNRAESSTLSVEHKPF